MEILTLFQFCNLPLFCGFYKAETAKSFPHCLCIVLLLCVKVKLLLFTFSVIYGRSPAYWSGMSNFPWKDTELWAIHSNISCAHLICFISTLLISYFFQCLFQCCKTFKYLKLKENIYLYIMNSVPFNTAKRCATFTIESCRYSWR